MTSNAFWGEQASGTWELEVYNFYGQAATVNSWSLTIWGDGTVNPVSGSATSPYPSSLPLVYTPEFAALATADTSRVQVNSQGTPNTLDLIALPNATNLDLNGSTASDQTIDGVHVTVNSGITNVNADGTTGSLTLHLAGSSGTVQCGSGTTSIYGGAYEPATMAGPVPGYTHVVNAGSGTTSVVMTTGSDEVMYFFGGSGTTTVTDGDYSLLLSCGSGPTTLIHVYETQQMWAALPISKNLTGMIDEVVGFTPGLDIVQLLGYSQAQIDYMLSNQRQMIEPSGQIDVQISDVGVPYVTDGKLVYPIGNWFIRFDKVSLVTPKFFGLTSATPPVNVSAPIYSSPSVTSAPGGQTTTTQDVAPGTTAVGNSTGPNQFQFNPGGGTAVGGLFSNTFMFDLGDGAATIQPGATSNTVRLGAGITASNLAFSDDAAGDLTISVVGTADNLIIEGDLLALNTGDGSSIISKVQNVTFSDGSLLSLDGNLSYSESVSSGNAVQSNTYGGSNFQFGSGGGTAVGGQFANSFAYGLGDGSAIIQPGSGSNVLSFGSGITASMLSYAANAAGDLTITVGNSGDSVTIEGNFAVQNGLVTSAVSSITLANGSSVLAAPPPLLAVQEQDVRLHVAPNAAFSFTLPANSFTDATGGTVTLSALQQNGTALPSWLSFAPSTGKFSGTMPTWQTTQGIKVIATTSEGAISAEGFNIYNTPPTPVLVTQQQDVRLHYAPTTAFSFVLPAGSFTDPAGGTVSLAATQPSGALPSWLSFNKSTGTFSGTMPAWQTTQGIVVTAITSEGATATEGFNIYNTAPAPVLQHQQNDLRVTFGVTFSATLPANSFTDPAGGTISLSATQANGGALPSCVQFNQSTGSLSGTMPINAATLGIKVSATSSEGGTAGEAFNFIGSAAAATLSAQMSDIRTTLGATISAAMPNPSFSDIYGSTFAYTAQQSNAGGALPSWLTFNASNATFSGVTPLTAGSLGVEIDAHGSYGTVGSEAFHIYW